MQLQKASHMTSSAAQLTHRNTSVTCEANKRYVYRIKAVLVWRFVSECQYLHVLFSFFSFCVSFHLQGLTLIFRPATHHYRSLCSRISTAKLKMVSSVINPDLQSVQSTYLC